MIFGINTTSDISKLLYVIWNIMSGIFAKYHVQIMLLFVYTTTRKGFVIFTCRYFKLSWNATDLSQSNCRNFSCSSISTVTFSEGGYTLSRAQNDKTFNIWHLVSATSTFSLKVVVKWRRLPPFRAKMTLVHARALLTVIPRKSRTRSRTRLRI